ncbi:MAG: peptide chain release factor-like protein, partial [Planctomycetes bacterium]|nr:peptide chain release factor-like protein [Planctomycetota bacterium]
MACDALASDAVLLRCCRVQRMPCGGPGGQHANKTATGVRLEHLASGIAATCCEHRDGAANRRGALARLRVALVCRLRGGGRQDLLRPLVRG